MKKWTKNIPDRKIVSKLMLGCGVSSLTAAILASRGYSTPENVMDKLNVSQLDDPFNIIDMHKAADIINEAIDNGIKICVYGDYDCDGIMSTVMLYTYLSETGADVFYYIPERSEGYGLNREAVEKIAAQHTQLIITVDNGITAVNEAEYIHELGMKLVITDHHKPLDVLPEAEAAVDPHRTECSSSFKELCGAGLVLKLIAALDGGDYTMALEQFGDLAAIATVADIVSLTGENRFIVSYGMQLIDNTDRPALIALKEVCKIPEKIDTYSIGFGIAPRINASGRFGSPSTAAELFICEDTEQTFRLAEELDSLNSKRKTAEKNIIDNIFVQLDQNPSQKYERVIFICGKGWHHGVIGIAASKISEHFGKPCFIASEENGEIRGSARSFGDFEVHKALQYCAETLDKFGGHPAAGGFTIKSGMTEEFHRLLMQYASENHKNMPVMTLDADYSVMPSELTVENVKGLSLLEPFGQDNEKPLFLIENACIENIIPRGKEKNHSLFKLSLQGTHLDALLFGTSPERLTVRSGENCDFMVTLKINEYNGFSSVNAYVKDYRPHDFEQTKIFAASSAYEMFMRNENLPDNYYRSMCPIRDDAVLIYKNIPENGISLDMLYIKIRSRTLNYCKLLASVEAFSELGLVSFSSADNIVYRLKAEKKVDFFSAPVIQKLSAKVKVFSH